MEYVYLVILYMIDRRFLRDEGRGMRDERRRMISGSSLIPHPSSLLAPGLAVLVFSIWLPPREVLGKKLTSLYISYKLDTITLVALSLVVVTLSRRAAAAGDGHSNQGPAPTAGSPFPPVNGGDRASRFRKCTRPDSKKG